SLCIRVNIRSEKSEIRPNRSVEADFEGVIVRSAGIVEEQIESGWGSLCRKTCLVRAVLLNVIDAGDPTLRPLIFPTHIPMQVSRIPDSRIDNNICGCRDCSG